MSEQPINPNPELEPTSAPAEAKPVGEVLAPEAAPVAKLDKAAKDAAKDAAKKAAKDAAKKAADKKEEEQFPFSVTVGKIYDGPLDLLLDLIRKQDIDVYDIPIAQITKQYLSYVEHIRTFDVDVAAEFIYMASLLIQIKSRMLLPRDPDLPAEQQDPRLELVNRLLEHERFKTAAQMLLQKQQLEDAVVTNAAMKEFRDAEGTEPELKTDAIDLVKTFQKILDRMKEKPTISFNEEAVTVSHMLDFVRRRLAMEDKPIRLLSLLRSVKSKQALVCAFLALLELIRLKAIACRQDGIFGEIIIKKSAGFDELENNYGLVRDDWR